jgi:enoyl-CoA hydratase
LNALSGELMDELVTRLTELDRDEAVRCIVLGGNERAFAAGADIGELARSSAIDLYNQRRVERWDAIRGLWTPLVAAVSGFCLGGGCELAMSCDLIVASETAQFGQPETTLGIIPGAGGTQRLTRAVGKAKAMEMCLTGRMMDAVEAERCGLVSRIVPADQLLDEAIRTAETIASHPQPMVMLTKEAVNRAYETTLAEGVRFERRLALSVFAFADQREGANAFIEKRKPVWQGK